MASKTMLSGPSLTPLSGGAPKQIVLLLHGYGSNGADLISLAPHWRQALPDTLFLSPNAPHPCGFMHNAFQWWGLEDYSPQALAAGAAAAAPALDAYIDAQLTEHGLSEDRLALVGFSQGTMMALHTGLRREKQIAGILGYSGMLTDPVGLAREIRSKPPVLLIHGSADPMIPVTALHEAKQELEKLDVDVASHVSPGLGHSIDPTGLRLGGEFVGRALRG